MWSGWEMGDWKFCFRVVTSNFILDFWDIKMTPLCLANSHLCSLTTAQWNRHMERTRQLQPSIFSTCVRCRRECRRAASQRTEVGIPTEQVVQLTSCFLGGATISPSDTMNCHCIPHQPATSSFCLGQTLGIFPTNTLMSEQSCTSFLIPKLDSTVSRIWLAFWIVFFLELMEW